MDNKIFSDFFDEGGEWLNEKRPRIWDEKEENLLDDDEFNAVLQKCLDALPGQWNTCVKLKYITGKKGKEICQELDIAPTNLWQIIHRAKLKLRDCVENNWFKDQLTYKNGNNDRSIIDLNTTKSSLHGKNQRIIHYGDNKII